MTSNAIRLDIELGTRGYPIWVGQDLLNQPALLREYVAARAGLIVSDDTVAPLYLERLIANLGSTRVKTCVLPDGEQHKTVANWQRILDALVEMGAQRDVYLIALGGGVIGDMTGFAAASYMRGVDFIQVPTTLLAQVDASVGGKTGINHVAGKNLIGAFHQPRCVIADTTTLSTLAPRQYRAGLAEVIKYGLIRDLPLLSWIESNLEALLRLDQQTIAEAVLRSCRNKAEVVMQDEREHGMRALLNLGHSFGHALEAATGYTEFLHGEAVAIGICIATNLSMRLGEVSKGDYARVASLLSRADLPTRVPPTVTTERIFTHMQVDKKNRDGSLHLVLPKGLGHATVRSDIAEESVRRAIDACR